MMLVKEDRRRSKKIFNKCEFFFVGGGIFPYSTALEALVSLLHQMARSQDLFNIHVIKFFYMSHMRRYS